MLNLVPLRTGYFLQKMQIIEIKGMNIYSIMIENLARQEFQVLDKGLKPNNKTGYAGGN
jgi:hypothetical protein